MVCESNGLRRGSSSRVGVDVPEPEAGGELRYALGLDPEARGLGRDEWTLAKP